MYDFDRGESERDDESDGSTERAADGDATDQDRGESAGFWTERRRSHVWTAVNVLGVVLLLAIVVPMLIFAVPQAVGAEHSYVVLSGSMEPAISPGDVVVVNDVDPSAIQQGDVINFARSSEERTTTHRVVDVVQQDGSIAFETKGDANEDADQELVPASQVRGKVMSVGGYLLVIPFIGYVIRFASTQSGFVLLLVVPMVLLVASELWNVVAATRESGDGDEASEGDDAVLRAASVDELPTEDDASDDGFAWIDAGDGGDDGTADAEAESEDALSFRATELELAMVVLAGFLVYSAYVASRLLAPWTVGVVASVVVALLLSLGLYLFGGAAPDDDGDDGDDRRVAVRTGDWSPSSLGDRRQPVRAFETLVELAAATGEPVLRDGDGPVHYVRGSDALYVHRGEPAGDWPALDDADAAAARAADDAGTDAETDDAATDDPGLPSDEATADTGDDGSDSDLVGPEDMPTLGADDAEADAAEADAAEEDDPFDVAADGGLDVGDWAALVAAEEMRHLDSTGSGSDATGRTTETEGGPVPDVDFEPVTTADEEHHSESDD